MGRPHEYRIVMWDVHRKLGEHGRQTIGKWSTLAAAHVLRVWVVTDGAAACDTAAPDQRRVAAVPTGRQLLRDGGVPGVDAL